MNYGRGKSLQSRQRWILYSYSSSFHFDYQTKPNCLDQSKCLAWRRQFETLTFFCSIVIRWHCASVWRQFSSQATYWIVAATTTTTATTTNDICFGQAQSLERQDEKSNEETSFSIQFFSHPFRHRSRFCGCCSLKVCIRHQVCRLRQVVVELESGLFAIDTARDWAYRKSDGNGMGMEIRISEQSNRRINEMKNENGKWKWKWIHNRQPPISSSKWLRSPGRSGLLRRFFLAFLLTCRV